MALATQFPELDPVALLELVEAPVIRMAFYEFRHRLWDEATAEGKAMIHRNELTKTLKIFEEKPLGFGGPGHRGHLGGGLSSHPLMRTAETPFSAFMSRVFAWSQQDHLQLSIAPSLRDSAIRAKLLWGILGVCISLHGTGEFPAPITPLPTSNEGDDLPKWEGAVKGSMGYDATWYPEWQEWRIRREALRDQTERLAFTRFWVTKVADDFFGLGHHSDAAEAEKFLAIFAYVHHYDDLMGTGGCDFDTKHLSLYDDKTPAAATDFSVSSPLRSSISPFS
ncbi:hypothetical protein F5Y14DRAFT_448872 [Nemania sp. NC0429]|nr:hypothetical protein F5Y14DRAFT_448872 [Nemania sp. NC0429]